MNAQAMRGKYEAAFILPNGSKKILGEDGWEFDGAERISPDILDFLMNLLKLNLSENYLGMERYVGENLQATVVYDDKRKIEYIAFQIYNEASQQLIEIFTNSNYKENNELFYPILP